jgi:predicted signal transduction protein with EAL and GGDEF domain
MSAAARIFDQLTAPFTIAGHEVTMTASVGWAVSEGGGSPSDDLLRNADLAMYAGKRQGKRCVVMYEPSMHEALSDRLQLETDLREALARGEITVAYQPIVAVDSGRVRSMEALARWTHPERGAIGPALFIPLAEQSGMIHEIGRFVLLTATAQLQRWQSERSFVPPIGINVNVSPFQLQGGRVVDDVREALRESGIDPWALTLEITESVLVDRGDNFSSTLEQLAQLGVRLAIDDFGTGFSSLSTLGRFPIDTLKIDRSFIEGVTGPDGGLELVRSIVELGGRLGLDVVAEGIETSAQADILRELSCTYGQGYHYARPLTAEAADDYLAEHSSPAPARPRPRPRRAGDPAAHAPAIRVETP